MYYGSCNELERRMAMTEAEYRWLAAGLRSPRGILPSWATAAVKAECRRRGLVVARNARPLPLERCVHRLTRLGWREVSDGRD